MVIKYRTEKNTMKVFSDEKVLPSDFKKWFLSQLAESFDLYEDLNGEFRLLSNKTIENSIFLSESEIAGLKNCYELEKIDNISFEKFLDLSKVAFADIFVFDRGASVEKDDMRNDKQMIAAIDLHPDGDSNYILIVCNALTFKSNVVNLIQRYSR